MEGHGESHENKANSLQLEENGPDTSPEKRLGSGSPKPSPDLSSPKSKCQVCGEKASGNFFGALVCLPCKSFFIRCTKESEPTFASHCGGKCDVSKQGRNRCQHCRYEKCVAAGMSRKEKPEAVEPGEGQLLCLVCGDIANGIHFGVYTCEGCKKFFRRGLQEYQTYVCKGSMMCVLNPRNRNNCRYCRYQKCLTVGMSREAIKMGRPKKMDREKEDTSCLTSNQHDTKIDKFKNPDDIRTRPVCDNVLLKPDNDGNTSSLSSESDSSPSSKVFPDINFAHLPLKKCILRSLLTVTDGAVFSEEDSSTAEINNSPSNAFSPEDYDGRKRHTLLGCPLTLSAAGGGHVALASSDIPNDNISTLHMQRISNGVTRGNSLDNDNRWVEENRAPGHAKKSPPRNPDDDGCLPLEILSNGEDKIRYPKKRKYESSCSHKNHSATSTQLSNGQSNPSDLPESVSWKPNMFKQANDSQIPLDLSQHRKNPLVYTASSSFPNTPVTLQNTVSYSNFGQGLGHHMTHMNHNKYQHSRSQLDGQHTGKSRERQNHQTRQTYGQLNDECSSNQQNGKSIDCCPLYQKKSQSHPSAVENILKAGSSFSKHPVFNAELASTFAGGRKSGKYTEIDYNVDKSVVEEMNTFYLNAISLIEKIQSRLDQVHEGNHQFALQKSKFQENNRFTSFPNTANHMTSVAPGSNGNISSNNTQINSSKTWDQNCLRPEEVPIAQRLDTSLRFEPVSVCKYWRQMKPFPKTVQMSSDQHRILQDMLEAYMVMLHTCDESHLSPQEKFSYMTKWPEPVPPGFMRFVVSRVIKQMKAEIEFMYKVPGFSNFHPEDRIYIIQNICFGNVTFMAANDWYNSETKTFRNMISWELPEGHVVYAFRQTSIELAEKTLKLQLDRTEAAMLSALNVAAADFAYMEEPKVIEKSRDFLIAALTTHLSYKGVDPEVRMKELFSLMPAFRLCGFWTKRIREEMTMKQHACHHDANVESAAGEVQGGSL